MKKTAMVIAAIMVASLMPSALAAQDQNNYVYNGTDWIPWLATSDGRPKIDLNLLNITADDAEIAGNVSATYFIGDGSLLTGLGANVSGSGSANYIAKFLTSGTIGQSLLYDNGTFVGIGTTDPQASLHVEGGDLSVSGIIYDALGTQLAIGGLDDIVFNTDQVFLDASSGYLGVGTTAPASGLHLYGNGDPGNILLERPGTGANLTIGHDNSGAVVGTLTNTPLGFRTNNAVRLHIANSSGNVGIGDTTPNARLEIQDDTNNSTYPLRITSGDTSWTESEQELGVDFYQTSALLGRIASYIEDGTNWGLKFYTYSSGLNSVPALTLEGSGNVGIGTGRPGDDIAGGTADIGGKSLHVKETASAANLILEGAAHADLFMIHTGGGANRKIGYWLLDSGELRLQSLNDDLTVNVDPIINFELNDGDVGIGEREPLGRLHVKTGDSGQTAASGTADEVVVESSGSGGVSILTPSSSTGSIRFGDESDNGAGSISYDHVSNNLTFQTNGVNTPRLRLTGDGDFLYNTVGKYGGSGTAVQFLLNTNEYFTISNGDSPSGYTAQFSNAGISLQPANGGVLLGAGGGSYLLNVKAGGITVIAAPNVINPSATDLETYGGSTGYVAFTKDYSGSVNRDDIIRLSLLGDDRVVRSIKLPLSPNDGGAVIETTAAATGYTAFNTPSSCRNDRPCRIVLVSKQTSPQIESGTYYQESDGDWYYRYANTASGGDNGDTTQTQIIATGSCYLYDDLSGTETSVSQWTLYDQSSSVECEVWVSI